MATIKLLFQFIIEIALLIIAIKLLINETKTAFKGCPDEPEKQNENQDEHK